MSPFPGFPGRWCRYFAPQSSRPAVHRMVARIHAAAHPEAGLSPGAGPLPAGCLKNLGSESGALPPTTVRILGPPEAPCQSRCFRHVAWLRRLPPFAANARLPRRSKAYGGRPGAVPDPRTCARYGKGRFLPPPWLRSESRRPACRRWPLHLSCGLRPPTAKARWLPPCPPVWAPRWASYRSTRFRWRHLC